EYLASNQGVGGSNPSGRANKNIDQEPHYIAEIIRRVVHKRKTIALEMPLTNLRFKKGLTHKR
ncbi:MAG: hypothetical protein ACE5GK_07825, partial [Nitrospiria bacterium]